MWALGLVGGLLAASAASAAPPTLNTVAPRGVQRGETVTLTLHGPGIGRNGPEILSELPGDLGAVQVESPDQIQVEVSVPCDAALGAYPIRVRTADGLTARRLVAVGDLPEIPESEPNDAFDQAHEVPLPATINGVCRGTDRDHFRFPARAGETIVVEVEARRLGSGLEPVLTILNERGLRLTSEADTQWLGDDPRLIFDVPEDGTYTVLVNDIRFAGSADPFYRLTIGRFACAEGIFPLGWQRGETVAVQWLGGTLDEPAASATVAPDDPSLAWVPVATPGPRPEGARPFRLLLSNTPEQLEPEEGDGPHPLTLGTVMNGRIAEPGEVDRYRLEVAPGQALSVDLHAASLGSRLDAVLKLLGPDGSVLAEADDSQGLDPQLDLTVPADVSEIIVQVEDLLARGGPAFSYRLSARPAAPDFTLLVNTPAITIPIGSPVIVPVQVVRRRFNEAIQLKVPSDLSGITASGGQIPAGADEGLLVLTAAAEESPRLIDLEIWGEGGPPAQPLRRPVRLARDGTPQPPQRPYDLPAAIGLGPPVTLTASADSLEFLHGGTAQLVVTAHRPEGHNEPITLTIAGLPPLVSGGTATIEPDQTEATFTFDVDSTAPVVPATLLITAKTAVDDLTETIALPPIAARVERPFALEVLTPEVSLAADASATVSSVVRRRPPFDGPVKITVEGGLPPHVRVSEVTIPAGEAIAQVAITAGAAAAPGTFDIPLRAATEMPGRRTTRDYVIPDVPVRVTITPPAPPDHEEPAPDDADASPEEL